MNRERGCTVVVSLHQVEYALSYCPRTVALRHGRVVYDGPSRGADARSCWASCTAPTSSSCSATSLDAAPTDPAVDPRGASGCRPR